MIHFHKFWHEFQQILSNFITSNNVSFSLLRLLKQIELLETNYWELTTTDFTSYHTRLPRNSHTPGPPGKRGKRGKKVSYLGASRSVFKQKLQSFLVRCSPLELHSAIAVIEKFRWFIDCSRNIFSYYFFLPKIVRGSCKTSRFGPTRLFWFGSSETEVLAVLIACSQRRRNVRHRNFRLKRRRTQQRLVIISERS